jgi:hypothetical protein
VGSRYNADDIVGPNSSKIGIWHSWFIMQTVSAQPINDSWRPHSIGDVYRQAANTRDQGHRSRRPGIDRQPIPLMLQQSQKKMKLEHIKCLGSIPCLCQFRQLMNSAILAGRDGKSIGSCVLRYRQASLYRQLSRYWQTTPPRTLEKKNYRLSVESLGSTREPCGRRNQKHANEDYQGPTPKEILTSP